MAQVPGAMTRGEVLANLLVKGQQADRVALQIKEVRQRGRKRRRVLRLRISNRAVSHRATLIGQQMTTKVGLILKFFDEIPITPGKDSPIQVARIVVRGVLSILGKLRREPVIGASVNPVPESLDDHPRAQFKIANAHQHFWIDERRIRKFLAGDHFPKGNLSVPSSRLVIVSTVMPSASAR